MLTTPEATSRVTKRSRTDHLKRQSRTLAHSTTVSPATFRGRLPARMNDELSARVGPDLDATAIGMADRRGRIAYWSAGATELLGYAAESMVGKAVSTLVPAAFPPSPHRRVPRRVGDWGLRAVRQGDDPGRLRRRRVPET
jgi:PAS domain-containing protein